MIGSLQITLLGFILYDLLLVEVHGFRDDGRLGKSPVASVGAAVAK
jgi:hypothetical protein